MQNIDISGGNSLYELDRRKKLAQQLQLNSQKPVQNNFQALTQILSGALGAYSEGKVADEEKAALAKALSSSGLTPDQQATIGQFGPDATKTVLASALANQLKPQQPLSKVAKIQADITAGRIDAETGRKALEAAVTPMMNPYQAANVDLSQQRLELQRQQGETANQMREDMRQERQQVREEQKAERGAEKYSTQLENSGLAEMNQQLKAVQSLIPAEGDIPGFGYGAAVTPDVFVSQEGLNLRQAVQGLQNAILKARSGGAVTPQEADRLLNEIGTGVFKNEDQLRTGINNISGILQTRLSNLAAGVAPEALDIYAERGGTVLPSTLPSEPPSRATPPAGGSPTPTKIQSDAEYESLPSGTSFIAPDGQLRRKP